MCFCCKNKDDGQKSCCGGNPIAQIAGKLGCSTVFIVALVVIFTKDSAAAVGAVAIMAALGVVYAAMARGCKCSGNCSVEVKPEMSISVKKTTLPKKKR